MGAQILAGTAAARPPAPASLDELHRLAQQHVNKAVHDQSWMWYPPLAQRHHAVTRLVRAERVRQEAELRADLAAILDAPAEVLRRMAYMQATSVACRPPTPYRDMVEAAAAVNAMRPQPSPAELVRQFAARGITITAQGGDLHVQPGDRLTEDDRALLLAEKPAILQALARPGVIL